MSRNWRHNADGLEDEKPREAQNGEFLSAEFSFSPPLIAGDSAIVRVGGETAIELELERGELTGIYTKNLRGPNNSESISVTRSGSNSEEASKKVNILMAALIPPYYPGSSIRRLRTKSDELTVMLNGNGLTKPLIFESSRFKALIRGSGYVGMDAWFRLKGDFGEEPPKITLGTDPR